MLPRSLSAALNSSASKPRSPPAPVFGALAMFILDRCSRPLITSRGIDDHSVLCLREIHAPLMPHAHGLVTRETVASLSFALHASSAIFNCCGEAALPSPPHSSRQDPKDG